MPLLFQRFRRIGGYGRIQVLFPPAARWLSGTHCMLGSRHRWLLTTSGGNKQEIQHSQFATMGLSNQKVHCDRRSSADCHRRSKSTMSGICYLKNPKVFKGLAFSESERDQMGLRGLLPAAVRSPELQVQAVLDNLQRYDDDLSRYLFLRELNDMNERLFYRMLCEHTEEMMPLVYTPVVGLACQEYSRIFRRPKGLFITINDAGRIYDILGNWPEDDVKAIVVTDGERILGLGDLGANGMGIPVGKLSLYTALAGIAPSSLLPVTIDVGTNNEKLLSDPFYIGLKQKRVNGEEYDNLIDEFMKAVVKRYGKSCLIQFEDFGNQNAFRLLEKYNDHYCTFNDDIQGTASVAVAGILTSMRTTKQQVSQNTFIFYGAGEAALGTADLLVMKMEEEGLSKEEAASKIWLVDSRGLVVKNRPSGGINGKKELYAKEHKHLTDLEEMMAEIKPTALIGVSAQAGVFTEKVLRMMLSNCERPIIFALSNPTDKAECTAEEAYTFTDGNCIFASGSPFSAVTLNEKTFHPGQGNNAYIFPGVALALIACAAHRVGDRVFLVAAKALAEQVTEQHMDEGRVYPPLDDIRSVSLKIAAKVARYLFLEGLATYKPEPPDLETFLSTKQYSYDYDDGSK